MESQLTNGDSKKRKVTVILGAQWGDEGKGKVVDTLTEDASVVARCQGGNNAGHTVVVGGTKYDFHLLPAGILRPDCLSVIGNGVVVNLAALFEELEKNKVTDPKGRLAISSNSHIVFSFHLEADAMQEAGRADNKIGTTKKGIGPAYASKAQRSGIRIAELVGDFAQFDQRYRALAATYRSFYPKLEIDEDKELSAMKEFAGKLKSYDLVKDTVELLADYLAKDKKILVEGANGTLLDIDLGTYPFVTSSNCSVGGVCTGLGLPVHTIGDIVGVVKAYQTRVGSGPFPTELLDDLGEKLRNIGGEYGTTTGRPRRCGWLDLVMLRRSHLINGFTAFALTKLDVLDSFDKIRIAVDYKLNGQILTSVPATCEELNKVEIVYETLDGWNESTKSCRNFSDLPVRAQRYIGFIEQKVGVKVRWIGVGQDREDLIEV